ALVGVVLLRRSVQPLLLPVTEAGVRLQRVAGTGDPATTPDDPQHLATAVSSVVQQLHSLRAGLEQEQQRYSRDMQIAGRIGREIATLNTLDTIVPRAINLICNELDLYHAQTCTMPRFF
ncbi:MAG: hypothetical protein MUE40_13705, partial [Anaerolineae bacterium]|nr:hypothetical protein [Anaerolineae bacterium]